MDATRLFVRHTLATLAYRAGKVIRSGSDATAGFDAGAGCRTPLQILAHISDVLEWGTRLAKGDKTWATAAPAGWEAEVDRFYNTIGKLEA
jgi:hypothetical protein